MGRSAKRPYRKSKRAEDEERTRLAITEAVMEMHRTVGPAQTTVTGVAELAGVTRMTVYKHFPTDADLIEACSTHWASLNPFPDPGPWTGIADPHERLERGLGELYAWYGRTGEMMGNVLRDAPVLPALDALMKERWWRYLDRLVDTFMQGREKPARRAPAVRAALRLALDFNTWRSLTRSGLSSAAAARLAASLTGAAAGGAGPAPHRRRKRKTAGRK